MQLLASFAKEMLCGPIVMNMANFPLPTLVCSLSLPAHTSSIEQWQFALVQGHRLFAMKTPLGQKWILWGSIR